MQKINETLNDDNMTDNSLYFSGFDPQSASQEIQKERLNPLEQSKTDKNHVYRNLQMYKKRMFIIVSFIFAFCVLIIIERLVSEMLRNNEVQLLFNVIQIYHMFQIQQFFELSQNEEGIQVTKPNSFLSFIGNTQGFLANFMLFTQFFLNFYVAIDALMAIKIIYPSLLGYYLISVLQLIYKSPKPYWVDEDIVSFSCLKTYGSPSLMSFMLPFILFYSCFLYKTKSMLESKSLVGVRIKPKLIFLVKIIGTVLILSYLFLVYIGGLIFLDHLALGIIYFGLYYTGLIVGAREVNNMIQDLFTQKKILFRMLTILAFSQLVVSIIHEISNIYPTIQQLKNFLDCLQNKSDYFQSIPASGIIGPSPTYSQTSVVMALIGLLFGVSYAFRNCKAQMSWYKGSLKTKMIRAIIVNVFLVPSWILIIYQDDFLKNKFIVESGLSEFLLNSVHFMLLYFIMYGLVPVSVFERLQLNKIPDTVITETPIVQHRAFSFIDN